MKKIYRILLSIKNRFMYLIYFIKYINYKKDFPIVIDINNTINDIVKERLSVSRFGDNELRQIANLKVSEDFYQRTTYDLQEDLISVIKSQRRDLAVCLPFIFEDINRYNFEAKFFWVKFISDNYLHIKPFLSQNSKYYNAFISRPYMDLKNKTKSIDLFNNIKRIWDGRSILIIEGENTRLGLNNDLFNNSTQLKRILCPTKNAYSIKNKILFEVKNFISKVQKIDNWLVLIALGPTATVLAFELSKLKVQSIDIGHIDIEYEWFSINAKKKVAIKNKYTNEIKEGRIETSLYDKVYESQIIKNLNRREK